MTSNGNLTENQPAAKRVTFPFFGAASLVAGAIMPTWAILGAIGGGPEAGGWVPLVLLVGFPFNVVSLALIVVAIGCGIPSLRTAGVERLLGLIGLTLAGLQLLAAAILVAVLSLFWFGG